LRLQEPRNPARIGIAVNRPCRAPPFSITKVSVDYTFGHRGGASRDPVPRSCSRVVIGRCPVSHELARVIMSKPVPDLPLRTRQRLDTRSQPHVSFGFAVCRPI